MVHVISRTCYTFPGYEIRKTACVLAKRAGQRDEPAAEFLGMKSGKIILDFKLLPCFICNVFSFAYLPGVRVLKADVSEHSIGSIFIGRQMKYPSTCL